MTIVVDRNKHKSTKRPGFAHKKNLKTANNIKSKSSQESINEYGDLISSVKDNHPEPKTVISLETNRTDDPLLNLKSKKVSNDQELIQSDLTSCPQNQKGNN